MLGRILFRYVALKSLKFIVVATLGLLLLFVAVDMVDLMTVVEGGVGDLFVVYWVRLPRAISFILPLSSGLGVALSVAHLHRRREWWALFATGRRPVGVGLALFLPVLVVTVGYPLWVAYVVPTANARFDALTSGATHLVAKEIAQKGGGYLFQRRVNGRQAIVQVKTDRAGGIDELTLGDAKDGRLRYRYCRQGGWMEVVENGKVAGFKSVQLPSRDAQGMIGDAMSLPAMWRARGALERLGHPVGELNGAIFLRLAVCLLMVIYPLLVLWLCLTVQALSSPGAVLWWLVSGGVLWGGLLSLWMGVSLGGLSLAGGMIGLVLFSGAVGIALTRLIRLRLC